MQGKQTLITSTSKLVNGLKMIFGLKIVIGLKTDHRTQN